jgi:hypothetical protein
MKLYISGDINIDNIKPKQVTIEEYLSLEGIFILKNNKALKYSLQQTEPDVILKNFINNKDCYISYDEHKYEGVNYYIPNGHNKITINRILYIITDKLTYVIDNIGNKTEHYFKSEYLLTDPNLKQILSTLVI